MVDLVQAQNDLTSVLSGAEQLANHNVFSYRKLRLANELDYRTLLSNPRNGKAGTMVMVMMPTADNKRPNVTGPVLAWTFAVIVVEMILVAGNTESWKADDGNGALVDVTGVQVSAEELGQKVMDVLHQEADEKLGTFIVEGAAMVPETEYVFPGCISYRTNLLLPAGKVVQTQRCQPVAIAIGGNMVTTPQAAAGTVTLSTTTSGADIYYTLDGSFPGKAGALQVGTLYSGGFAAASGQTLRAAAYKTGMNKSATRYVAIT